MNIKPRRFFEYGEDPYRENVVYIRRGIRWLGGVFWGSEIKLSQDELHRIFQTLAKEKKE